MNIIQFPSGAKERNFGVIVMEAPYDTFRYPEARTLFSEFAYFKIQGYQNGHPYGVLPVDAYDFISNHIIVGDVSSKTFTPLMGFKSVTLDRCIKHRVAFPTQELLRGANLPNHEAAINGLVDEYRGKASQLAYNGSWTIDPRVREDKELSRFCKDLTFALLVQYYRTYQIPMVLAAAVTRFKVHKLKEFLGWEYITNQGAPLEEFPCEHFFNEPLSLMFWRKFSDEALALADRYQEIWDRRVTYSAEDLSEKKQAA